MKIRYLNYLKGILFPFIFLTFPFSMVEQFIYEEASQIENRIVYGVIGIVLSMIEGYLILVILGYGVKKLQATASENITVGKYFKKHLRDIVIESLRALGEIAVAFLLLIVPGFIRLVHYYLIPYVVLFDLKYQEGKLDALEESKALVKSRFWQVSGLLALTQIVSIVLQITSIKFNLFTTPVAWILFYVAEVLLQITVFWVFYNYYLKLKSLKN